MCQAKLQYDEKHAPLMWETRVAMGEAWSSLKSCSRINPLVTKQSVRKEGDSLLKAGRKLKLLFRGGCGGELSRSHQDNNYTFLEAAALQLTTGWPRVMVRN